MTLSTCEYKFLNNWVSVYLSDELCNLLTTGYDLPEKVRLNDEFYDVSISSLNCFQKIDYQDFWINLDVQNTFIYLNDQKSLNTEGFTPHLVIPTYPFVPEVENYYQLKYPSLQNGAEVIFDNGHIDNTNLYTAYSYIVSGDISNCFFGNIISGQNYIFLDSDIVPDTGNNWAIELDNDLDNIRYKGNPYSVVWDAANLSIQEFQTLRGPDLTRGLISSLSAFPKNVFTKQHKFNYNYFGGCQAVCFNLETLIGVTLHDNVEMNILFGNTDGQFGAHQFSKYGWQSDWYEYFFEWGNGYYLIDGGMQWGKEDGHLYCTSKYLFQPEDNYDGKFRLYANMPTFCNYGNLNTDIYIGFWVSINSHDLYVWRKIPNVYFEPTEFYNDHWGNVQYYTLRSVQNWSLREMMPVDVLDENAAPNQINQILTDAGLSPIDFDTINYVDFSIQSREIYLVWNFSHPVLEDKNHHFPNQDQII